MAWRLAQVEASEVKRRAQWYAFVRLLLLLSIVIPGLLSFYIFEGWSNRMRIDTAISVIAIAGNLLFFGLVSIFRNARYLRLLTGIWISLDILLISVFIFVNGGIESRSPILYTVPILISAALFGRRGIYVSAAGSILFYVALIAADYAGIIQSIGAFDPTLRTNLPYVINTICFFPSILLVIAIAIDFITSLLFEKQQEVSEAVETLETAQEIAKVGSWSWDIEKDEITWSKELFRIYGIRPRAAPMNYQSYLKMLPPEQVSSHKKTVLNALNKRTSFQVDHQIQLADGSIKYLHGEGRPEYDKNGTVVRMSGTSQDITDIHHLDIAKREFVSLASHQLRTPASGVKAFLSLLIDGYGGKLTTKQRSFVKQAFEANDKQLEIIDNLLSLASIESGTLTVKKETINLQDVVSSCLPNHMLHVRQKKQKLSFRRQRKIIRVDADAGALQMAIDNLISNAIKYSQERGRITMSTRVTKTAAYLEVTDDGIGIAKKDLPVLFQKFRRLNNPASKTVGGSGLGLYMARYIVELHGGKIMVRSRTGHGTTFTIKLPLSDRKR